MSKKAFLIIFISFILLFGQAKTTLQHTVSIMPKLELVIVSGDGQRCAVSSSPDAPLVAQIQYVGAKGKTKGSLPIIPLDVVVADPDGATIETTTINTEAGTGIARYNVTPMSESGTYTVKVSTSLAEFSGRNIVEFMVKSISVEIININAADPYNTIVNYRSSDLVDQVTFTTPGGIQDVLTNVNGDFSFVFNQEELEIGTNSINLVTSLPSSIETEAVVTERIQAYDLEISPAVIVADGVYPCPITHEGYVFYHQITYNVSFSGKTTLLKNGIVNISTILQPDIPSDIATIGSEPMWIENHPFEKGGQTIAEFDLINETETWPQQSANFRSKSADYNNWYENSEDLVGIFDLEDLTIEGGDLQLVPPTELELIIE